MAHKEAASILSHGAHGLAKVKEEASRDVLHNNEDKVVDNTAGWLDHLASVSEVVHTDNSNVVKVLEDCNFILNGKNGVFVASQELLLEDLNGNVSVSGVNFSSEVDFASVSFSETLEDLVLAVEDRVF